MAGISLLLTATTIQLLVAAVTIWTVPAKIAAFTAKTTSANRVRRGSSDSDTRCWSSNFHRRFRTVGSLRAVPDDDDEEEAFVDEEDDDDDDEEEDIKPYGNRSLAWTKRYRRLNPYEKVRRRVLRFGHRSKADWDECVASGHQGQYVPARPDEMYAPEWVSWEEFLGLMRPYEDTKNLAVNVLGLKSFDQYILFVRQNPKRAEGLRIPLRPDLVYKNEWIDEEHFFGRKD